MAASAGGVHPREDSSLSPRRSVAVKKVHAQPRGAGAASVARRQAQAPRGERGNTRLGSPHHDSAPSSSAAHDCSTISFTLRSYSLRFSWYSRAASELAGEFGFGSHSSDWIDVKMAEMS